MLEQYEEKDLKLNSIYKIKSFNNTLQKWTKFTSNNSILIFYEYAIALYHYELN
jgi:hypothetical protein